MFVHKSIESLIGNTPVIKLQNQSSLKANLHIKLEGQNLAGSVKDRSALFMMNKIIEDKSNDGKIILTASSGSFATSVAIIGSALNRKTHVVTTQKLTKEKLDFINLFNTELTSHGKFTIEAVDFCINNLMANDPGKYVFIDQLHDWNAPLAHYNSTGPEVLRDTPNVKAVFFSLGSGATLFGVAKFLKENKDVKVFAVTSSRGTSIPGAGAFLDGDYKTPFIKEGYEKGFFDETIEIDSNQAAAGVKDLRNQGIFVGLQSGAVFSAMIKASLEENLTGDVLMISGDSGWKNTVSLKNALN